MLDRKCGIEKCLIRISTTRLYCDEHWSQVPAAQKKALMDAYTPNKTFAGQTLDWVRARIMVEQGFRLREAKQ